jgi:hypothetical protein
MEKGMVASSVQKRTREFRERFRPKPILKACFVNPSPSAVAGRCLSERTRKTPSATLRGGGSDEV